MYPGSVKNGSFEWRLKIPEVKVAIPRELRSFCGGHAEFSISAHDIRGLLAEIARQHPQVHVRICDERGAPRPHINVFVNDQLCARAELDMPLAAGEMVTILPAVSGGSRWQVESSLR
jgi:molybdopterin converting factor small subunit